MSSSNTSWTTESNTKSGSVKVYSSDVSVLKVVAGEGGDALIDLFADQGDDNADKWRLWVNASDDDLHFSNYTSGTAWTDILTLQDGGNVGIGKSSPGNKLEVDGNIKLFQATDALASGIIIENAAASNSSYIWQNGTSLNLFTQADTGITILDGGNVGIGVSSPGANLEIADSSAATLRLDDTGYGYFEITQDGGKLALTAETVGTMMTLDGRVSPGTGNVGIGTDAPETKLHIQDNSAGTIATVTGALLTCNTLSISKCLWW